MGLTCEACGAQYAEGDAFCGECGATVTQSPETVEDVAETPVQQMGQGGVCSSCGGQLTVGERFCPWCGFEAVAAAIPHQAPGQGMPGGQVPPDSAQPAGGQAAAAFSQGTGEVTDRLQRAWSNRLMRAPLVFLGLMALGFLLPLASYDVDLDRGSYTMSDLTSISVVILLLISVVLLVLLVLHATSPDLGSAPIFVVAGVSLVIAVVSIVLTTILLAASAGLDELASSIGDELDSDELSDASFNVGIGAYLLLLGAVGLFITSFRAGIQDSGRS